MNKNILAELNYIGLDKAASLSAFKTILAVAGTPANKANYDLVRTAYWELLTSYLTEKYTVYSVKLLDHSPVLSGLYTLVDYGIQRKESKAIYTQESNTWHLAGEKEANPLTEIEKESLYWIN